MKEALRTRVCALLVALICALALCAISGGALRAWAVDSDETQKAEAQKAVDTAQDSLETAEQRMKSIAEEYDVLAKEIDELQKTIDETSEQAKVAQQAVIEGRAQLGKSMDYEYREGGAATSLLTMVLEASDFNELLRNVSYLGAIVQYQADEVAAQKERSDHFNSLIDDLNFQKNEQEAKLEELEKKKAEAEQVVADAKEKLQGAQNDQAARLAELEKKAEELAAAGKESEPVVVEEANTVDREDVVKDTEVKPDPNPNPPAEDNKDEGEKEDNSANDVGWSTGIASAYGGATDPYTKNPGITATGAICDDNSMGVAVPMAWPKYWKYYGRTVEISYNGMTVLATINDCGYMGGGSRSLDLQPGVWKAFGYSSCNDWGLRRVSYRIL